MLRYALLDRALAYHLLPDAALTAGVRLGTRMRLRGERQGGVEAQEDRLRSLVWYLSNGPIAERPDASNQQRYELPAEFFTLFLGPRHKYSCGLWTSPAATLEQAETDMLALTCERAGVQDGMDVVDLGCGWGSLSLYLAERYPNARVTGVSASPLQRAHIERRRAQRQIDNLQIVTADANRYALDRRVDRILSIELFEHMRNWKELLRRTATHLRADGRAFVQVFSHRSLAYRFEGSWAAERFLTGGTMPSHDLMLRFQEDLTVEDRWAVSGTHYARTARAWLERLDANSARALVILEEHFGRREARRQLAAWRLFFISTAEIWGWRAGDEWLVSHYRLAPRHT
jgi:cyclopropane-fatty-acyl-phospholipid synthase